MGTQTAPSVLGNTHFAFLVDADTPLNEFVTRLENVSHARGHTNVRCNTVNNVTNEVLRRKQVQRRPEHNSYQVDDGDFAGWQLAYCKGPDNEQLEFNHAYSKAGEDYDQARGVYVTGGTNEMWRRRLRAWTRIGGGGGGSGAGKRSDGDSEENGNDGDENQYEEQ